MPFEGTAAAIPLKCSLYMYIVNNNVSKNLKFLLVQAYAL